MEVKSAESKLTDPGLDLNTEELLPSFTNTRKLSEELCEPLEIEDFVSQPIVDVSPPKWHLAHTTWFFEELILKRFKQGYNEFNKQFSFLFNSYYETVGERTLRPDRGNMTRPTVTEILRYREYVNDNMSELLSGNVNAEVRELATLGINHEQQHQELLVTDLKYILGHNPVFPKYIENSSSDQSKPDLDLEWLEFDEGIYEVGHKGKGFHFDNEGGRHKTYLHHFEIMDRLVTNGEYLEFIESGGYKEFRWWLSEAWDWVNREDIHAPMYWYKVDGKWMYYTLEGFRDINPEEPLTHISHFEADAYAQWKEMRLPTEFEWEVSALNAGNKLEIGTFLDDRCFHPKVRNGKSTQLLGDVWEWTNSAYLPYPYFKKAPGAVGEYNGKFMVNQKVLRGGSCATPRNHIRVTYRNFFHPHLRWQFNGFRLARTIE